MNPFRFASVPSAAPAALLLAWALSIAAAPAHAASDDAERHRLDQERAAIEARYAARARECRERFVVTSCVDDAKVERRRALDVLRTRQLQLDEEKRRARAAERSAELAAKAADDARREQERAARAAATPATREPRPLEPRHERPAAAASSASASRHGHTGATTHRPAKKPVVSETEAQRREKEERHRETFEARQKEAEAHRQEVLDRATQRHKDRPPASPLPVPAPSPVATPASVPAR